MKSPLYMAKKKKRILEGHKKVGKKYIPQILQWPGFREINWVNDIIPELIWIAVLQQKIGYRIASEAMADLHKMYIEVCDTKYLHSFFSSYHTLSDSAKETFRKKFEKSEYYEKVFEGLKDLQHYYPNHPLQFLYEGREIKESEVNIQVIKDSIKGVLERRSKRGTIAQASVLFNSIATGKFNSPAGSIFWEFTEIDNYPDTDKSLQLASSIRAMINAFMNKENKNMDCEWVKSFWQNSFIIEPPTLKLIK
jgi:hypothetical protein